VSTPGWLFLKHHQPFFKFELWIEGPGLTGCTKGIINRYSNDNSTERLQLLAPQIAEHLPFLVPHITQHIQHTHTQAGTRKQYSKHSKAQTHTSFPNVQVPPWAVQ